MATATGNYGNIISLGSNCAPAAAIREYFGIGKSYPFDWWISTLEDLAHAAKNRFEKMFEEDEVETYKVITWSVWSRRYRIAYYHDFPKRGDSYEMEDIRRELPKVREKYERRFARLHEDVSRVRTLFIRYGIDGHNKSQKQSVPHLYELEAELRAIWPKANFDILALPLKEPLAEYPEVPGSCVAFDELGPVTGEMWRREQFNALFARRDIRYVPATHP